MKQKHWWAQTTSNAALCSLEAYIDPKAAGLRLFNNMPQDTLSRSSSLASDDFLGAISEDAVPSRPSTTPQSEIQVPVEGVDGPLKLAVDAGPGCGGIAWPAGEVSDYDLGRKRVA